MTELKSIRRCKGKQVRGGGWSKEPDSDINKHFAMQDIRTDAADKSRVAKRKTRKRSDINVEGKE